MGVAALGLVLKMARRPLASRCTVGPQPGARRATTRCMSSMKKPLHLHMASPRATSRWQMESPGAARKAVARCVYMRRVILYVTREVLGAQEPLIVCHGGGEKKFLFAIK